MPQIGHESIPTTIGVYGKARPAQRPSADDVIGSVLS